MNFGIKLAMFLAIALAAILGGTGLATYISIRDTLIDDGKDQITTGAGRFVHQLDEIERQVAFGVNILSLDFALRAAVSQHDRDTAVSALRNHGRRVGASRMLLIETDGTISADTDNPTTPLTRHFEFQTLLDRASVAGRVATVAVLDGAVDWLVVVPVLAPDPIAFVAVVLPLNDELLVRLRELTGLPEATGLAKAAGGGRWQVAAGPIGGLLDSYLPATVPLPLRPEIRESNGDEAIVLASTLATPPGSPSVTAVFLYPLSDALRRYQRLILILIAGLGGGLVAAVVGALLIVRGVARPLELLASYTKLIAAGDYALPPPLHRDDEIGQLSTALGSMARAIADREKRIRHQSSHDPVTNLPNRQALLSAMDPLPLGGSAAVIVIGMVRLQEIANTVGRDIADRTMRDAATRLALLLGHARLGCMGDRSFAAFLPECDSAGALAISRRITDAFDLPYREGELSIDASVAVGVAMAPLHGTEAELLLRRADVALQSALHAESRTAVYRAENDPHRPERLSLMSDLRRGLRTGEFELRYQPKLDLRAGRITGAEALVRWQHPTRGPIAPEGFTSLAEETGNIQYLTRWSLETGLAEVARWRDAGHALRVSVNISVRDLANADLVSRIATLLRTHALPGEALVLEVTEGAIMREPDAAIAVLQRLADQDVVISIDDFGVGQSSLTYLRRLPVGELKIDKAFILRLPRSADDQTIVRSVVELGHSLGYVVTAEGVEDVASIELLRQFGCDYAQGFLIAQPLVPMEFSRFVAQWPERGLLVATS